MTGRIIGHGEKTRYLLDGEEVTKEVFDLAFPDKKIADNGECSLTGWARPIKSDAMAVHPEQIGEVIDRNRKHGLHIEYLPDGRPKLTSREQRKQLMRIEGFHDNNGGYGDDTGKTTSKAPERKIMKGL